MNRVYRTLAGIAVLAAVIILFGTQAIAFVKAGYPPDSIRREALNRCATADPRFLRFSEADRTECYKTAHLDDSAALTRR